MLPSLLRRMRMFTHAHAAAPSPPPAAAQLLHAPAMTGARIGGIAAVDTPLVAAGSCVGADALKDDEAGAAGKRGGEGEEGETHSLAPPTLLLLLAPPPPPPPLPIPTAGLAVADAALRVVRPA
jgi:hypothetical protein